MEVTVELSVERVPWIVVGLNLGSDGPVEFCEAGVVGRDLALRLVCELLVERGSRHSCAADDVTDRDVCVARFSNCGDHRCHEASPLGCGDFRALEPGRALVDSSEEPIGRMREPITGNRSARVGCPRCLPTGAHP